MLTAKSCPHGAVLRHSVPSGAFSFVGTNYVRSAKARKERGQEGISILTLLALRHVWHRGAGFFLPLSFRSELIEWPKNMPLIRLATIIDSEYLGDYEVIDREA